jgi:penicillin-binding protein 1A
MSLPSWALFMKKCYADKTLNVSLEDFEKPENLTINIDCGNIKIEEDKDIKEVIPEEDTDF